MAENDFVIKNGILEKYTGSDEHLVVPDGVTEIPWGVLRNCKNIRSIEIPDSVKTIHPGAFAEAGAEFADSEGFCRAGSFLIKYIGNKETVRIPDGIKTIVFSAFSRNENIKRVILPSSIEVIENQAFSGCEALEEVIFPDNCNAFHTFGYGAFSNCVNLKSINAPDSVTTVENAAFYKCDGLRDDKGFLIVGKSLVSYSEEAESVTVPDGIKMIGDEAFKRKNIRTVVLPEGLHTIGASAFEYSKLETIIIPDSVKVIKESAFSNCENLKTIKLPENLTEISDETFYYSSKIKSICVPDSVISIGYNAFQSCSSLETVTIPDSVKSIGHCAFENCSALKSIVIPSSVKVIEKRTFHFCPKLKEVVLENGVEKISENAFDCCYSLSDVVIPESITEIGEKAFFRCPELKNFKVPQSLIDKYGEDLYVNIGVGDENGCVIKDKVMLHYIGEGGTVKLTDGIETIEEEAFSKGYAKKNITEIILPDSLKIFKNNHLPWNCKINIPEGYLRQTQKLPAAYTDTLLNGVWKSAATLEDYAALYSFQSGKDLMNTCSRQLDKNPEESTKAFIEVLKNCKKTAAVVKAAEFLIGHKKDITQESINGLFAVATANKAQKAIDLIKPLASKTGSASVSKKDTSVSSDANPVEIFCAENFAEPLLDKSIKKAGLKPKDFTGVAYKGSKKPAPDFVIKCAIVPYMDLMEERPKNISGYKTDYLPLKFLENSDKAAAELDTKALRKLLLKISDIKSGYEKPQRLIPFCRFAEGADIQKLITETNKWTSWYTYASKGRSAIIVARGAIMLNDSREAIMYAEKNKCLSFYARLRKTDENSLRDNILSDFGLDENGKKIFDLGNTTLEVTVDKELSLSVYDTVADKIVKSVPKKGADPEKYEQVSVEFSDLKKNLKKVVKARNDLLYNQFLSGQSRTAESWKSSYLNIHILRKVAELIVWNQEGNTFIVSEKGTIDCNGNPYEIADGVNINVAHPMEMTPEVRKAWQSYFTSNNLKQPFEQVWEPVVDVDSIKADRYAGCMIPLYRFKGQEQRGISINDYDFHNSIIVDFYGFNANVERIDWARHQINMDDRFEIKSISVRNQKTYSRKMNGIIAYLDRITVYDRIAKDDASVADMFPSFTYAQITDFIKFATENNCTNITAILLDYKNSNFSEFEPMDEFVL